MPLRDQSIGRQPCMKRTACRSVDVDQVPPCNGTQAANVEVSVLSLQRIECPFNQRNSSSECIVPLRQFQLPANSEIAKLRKHASHMGVKVRLAIANSRIGQSKAGHGASDKSTQYLSANFGGHHVHLRWHHVSLDKPPHTNLECDHLLEFLDCVAGAYCDCGI